MTSEATGGTPYAPQTTGPAPCAGTGPDAVIGMDQTRSKRSRSETLAQAATKSFTNFSLASSLA